MENELVVKTSSNYVYFRQDPLDITQRKLNSFVYLFLKYLKQKV